MPPLLINSSTVDDVPRDSRLSSNPNCRPRRAIIPRLSPQALHPHIPCLPHHIIRNSGCIITLPKLNCTWQLKSHIQPVTWTLKCEAKEKVLTKLEFQTWVSTSVMLPCLTIHDLALHSSAATQIIKNAIKFLVLTKETHELLPRDLGN